MNITVYLGANAGHPEKFAIAVKELGAWIGKRQDTLVYGGSKTGLMRLLADSVLSSGGRVIGVEPQMFVDQNLQYDAVDTLIITRDMAERKAKMRELGDVFLAFPGGTGTLEEISEIMSCVSLKMMSSPCILYNLDGYYDGLKELLGTMVACGFSTEDRLGGIWFADSLPEIEAILRTVG